MLNLVIDGKNITAREKMTHSRCSQPERYTYPHLMSSGRHPMTAIPAEFAWLKWKAQRRFKPPARWKFQRAWWSERPLNALSKPGKPSWNFLLADGEHNCLICEKNGDCKLQDMAYELGVGQPSHFIQKPPTADFIDVSEMIIRDNRKCILCRRCVTACNELVVNGVLGIGYRGGRTTIVCDNDKPMGESSCVQCGECVQKCPVGALTERKAVGKGRTWAFKKVRTHLPLLRGGLPVGTACKGRGNRQGQRR